MPSSRTIRLILLLLLIFTVCVIYEACRNSEFRNKDNALIADAFELAAGKSISTLTLLEAPEFGNVDCTVTITAFRDGKQIGTLNTELTLHTAYLWPKEVQ